MITIACVLKTGEWNHPGHVDKKVEYGPEHVRWLKAQVENHCKVEHRFVCLSDIDVPGVEVIPLKHNWPGWWSKMELFRDDLGFDQVFYLDLDTVIVGDITDMVESRYPVFMTLRNLSRGRGVGSGVMSWSAPDGHFLYNKFAMNPELHMESYVTSARWGDQGFLQDNLRNINYFQNIFPGELVSKTFDMRDRDTPPDGARIVIFHGKLKPWHMEASWIPPLL